LALALSLYGTELLRVWINPEFALNSGPIIPAIAISTTLGIAAQFNSSSILFGLGKHRGYAYSLLIEAILSCAAIYVAVPRYGIAGAAWVTAAFLVLNRGLVTSWLFSRAVEQSFGAYLRGVYVRPTLAAIPAFLGAWWIKVHWLPGRNWIEVLGGMGLLAAIYYLVAFPVCVEKEHRSIPWRWVTEKFSPHPAV
jgi:O-antigen/teichoic acid export membrane protein